MAGGLVRNVGYGGSKDAGNRVAPLGKRSAFVLSDGSRVAVVCDYNQSGVSGDGGDNSNIVKFYIYTSPDGVTWTLKATITPATTFQPTWPASVHWCATVGANNNVHVIWAQPTGEMRYRRADFSAGPTYTLQAEEQVHAAITNVHHRRLDVDIPTGNIVVFGYNSRFTGGASSTWHAGIRLYVRNASNVWIAQPYAQTVSTGQTTYQGGDEFTLSCDAAGPVSNEINVMCVSTRKRESDGADLGDVLWRFRVNTSTGAAVSNGILSPSSITLEGFGHGYQSGIRSYMIFSSGNNEWTLIGHMSRLSLTIFVWRFTYVGSTLTDLIGKQYKRLTYPGARVVTDANDNFSWVGFSYGNDTAIHHAFSGGVPQATVMTFSRSPHSVAFMSPLQPYDENYNFSGAGVYGPAGHGGNNRNFSFNKHGMLWFASAPSYRVEYFENKVPLTPGVVVPATSSTVSTDRPVLSADHKWSLNIPQFSSKLEWQLATDAGFTTNLRTITEPDADYLFAYNTGPSLAKVTSHEQVTQIGELFQGTWYVRSRMISFIKDIGPWSTAQSFNVTHPPSASNLYPSGDVTFKYGAGGAVTFDWAFSDPSPYDFQTAYQIVVEKTVDGTSILDTGKVVSVLSEASHNIPVGGKDFQLRWKIRLWDSDDVVGSYTTYETFYTVDDPTVVINTPADSAVVDTGNLTVSWTTTVGGVRTQTHYRVLILDGATVIYDSSWQLSSSNSHVVPVGYILNLETYSVQVEIRDNLNLSATDTNTFSTLFDQPDAPTPTVSVANYQSDSYIRVSWTDAVEDPDFVAWIVYRRVQGETTWSLLETISEALPSYNYDDYLAGSGITYEYSVTQLVNRFGSLVESDYPAVAATGISENYWLLHPTDSSKNLLLRSVTNNPHTDETEQESFVLVGRGRHVEYGDYLGIKGSLTVKLRDNEVSTARAMKLKILALKKEKGFVYLRNPFGDIYIVNLGNISISPIAGVGRSEFVDLDIPYEEVAL